MQSRTFNRLSTAAIVILALGVLFWIGQKAASIVPFPDVSGLATSTTASDMPLNPAVATTSASSLPILSIKTPRGVIHAMVASTEADRDQGLSDLASLPEDSGMLFVFPHPGDYGFWMKDMHFPLDMVWILSDKSVVSVTTGVSPDTYPQIFFPPLSISYVLELDSGGAAKHGIATDTKLVF